MMQSIVRWYIAKIKLRTENKIIKYLNQLGIESFHPLQPDGQPLLPCLLFVRISREQAIELPKESGLTLDFQYDPATHQLQYVPDKAMENFIFMNRHTERLIVFP
ncbi:MAG: hypothetical protein LBH32_14750, partial [Dysgonamonadaceae bacterium]|nr:hypothetical protein [Dysgonamonadaceae bacterium]